MADEKKTEETSPEANASEETKPKSNLMNYIIMGVGGILLIVGIAFGVAFMLKDSPKAEGEHSAEVSDNSHEDNKTDDHASVDTDDTENSDHHEKSDSHNSEKSTQHATDNSHGDNLEISMDDYIDAGSDEDEFDSRAIEKIVENLAVLEYTPTEAEMHDDDALSVEDSLAQMSWIEKEKNIIATRKKDLDAREKDLNKMEISVDAKIIRIEQAESNRTSLLAKLYDGMDSRAVAKLMMNLDDITVVTILPRMKSKNAAQVLQLIPSKRAAVLSKKMITIAGN